MSYSSWSYAPTNRASCKGKCKTTIQMGAIRLGTSGAGAGGYTMVSYRCLSCVTKQQFKNMVEKFGSVENVEGFSELNSEDQGKVRAAVEACAAAPKSPLSRATASHHIAEGATSTVSTSARATSVEASEATSSSPDPTSPSSKITDPSEPPLSQAEQHAFADAAKQLDLNVVMAMLQVQPQLINVQPSGRWSALHHFAQAGHSEAVEYLVRRCVGWARARPSL